MDTKLVKNWIDAMESGDYPQTTGSLKYTDAVGDSSYCCLGVLIEIEGCMEMDEHHEEGMPSDLFLEKVKLDSELANTLAKVNDDRDDFEDVINIIKRKLGREIYG